MRMLGIRATLALDEWLCVAPLAGQPSMPIMSYEAMAELLEEYVTGETTGRDEDWRAFPMR